jgi:porphobilinogen synthase
MTSHPAGPPTSPALSSPALSAAALAAEAVAAARPGRVRPRRMRGNAALRRSVSEVRLHPADLVLPVFVKEGLTEPQPIASMPGVVQHSRDSLRRAVAEAAAAGVSGVNLFGVPLVRDAVGSGATDPDGILNLALADVRAEVGDALVVQADLCLDEFTDHGHCGVLRVDGTVDNDSTLVRYAEMALAQAEAGAHMVAPSGMMDGQVGVIRDVLDAAGRQDVAVLAYAAKFASVLYGPFRDAVESTLDGDRRTYQMDPANRREALLEVDLDIAEGADVVMVKPAGAFLDVLADVAAASTVPVAAYQVSGEYAMVEAAAARGWLDRRRAITESVLGIRRAGADQVLTYWAVELACWLREEWR